MLLQDEQYVIKWLSQYGALRYEQVLRLLDKPPSTAEKIIRNLKKWHYITDIETGYLGIDPTVRPDPKTIEAVWVLLKYGAEVAPLEHFPAAYPSQLFFLKQQAGYEIIVLAADEGHLLKLLQPEDDRKYIIVLPDIHVARSLRLPRAPCLFAVLKEAADGKEPQITFYNGGQYGEKTPSPFKRDIDRACKRLQLASMVLRNVRDAYAAGDRKEAYQNAFEFAYHTERLTLLARTLPALTGIPAARSKMEHQIAEVLPLHIGYTADGWFGVDMPALLPKKEHGGADYIRQNLYLALGEYFKSRDKLRLDACVLVVCHRYDRNRPERAYRDHDNIELNAVVDALALYALYDDGPLRCEHHYCSLQDDRDATTVLLVPQDAFTVCYTRIKTAPQMLLPLFP